MFKHANSKDRPWHIARLKESLGFGRHVSLAIFLSAFNFGCENNVKSGPDKSAVHYRTATELTAAIRRGEITSLELLNLYIDRIDHYNDDINAVIALDAEAAQARAREADKALAQGRNWGPLHGLPMTVKDVFEVVGMPATSGDPMLKYNVPKCNAEAVQRLVDAGAIIFAQHGHPTLTPQGFRRDHRPAAAGSSACPKV